MTQTAAAPLSPREVNNPSRIFRDLCAAFAADKTAPEVERHAAELAARVAAGRHDYGLHNPRAPFIGLCVAVIPTSSLHRYGGVAKVLDEYGVELRFKRLESNKGQALVWVCPGRAVGSGPFAGASVGERRAAVWA